jgi:hypothetical protein
MQQLSNFKYAVNLMPTVAAGTFSMNCAYWGIPCIGNIDMDTQATLFPSLSVDINDIDSAVSLATHVRNNMEFYNTKSEEARNNLNNSYHIDQKKWLAHIEKVINE